MHLLVVDDSPTLLRWFVGMVEPLGHHLVTATSAEAALDVLAAQPVDLLVTDLMMPGMGGAALLAEVRRRHPHLPVVIMSGVGTVSEAVELIRCGADEYLPKPLRQDEFLSCLERVGAKARIYQQSRLFDGFVDSLLSTDGGDGRTLPAYEAARAMVLLRFDRLYAERLARTPGDVTVLSFVAGLPEQHVRELLERHRLAPKPPPPPGPDFLTPP